VPPVRFHDLRHFAAGMGLAAGSDIKVVAEELGHARSDFTWGYYAVVAPEQGRAPAEAAAALIPRSRRSGTQPDRACHVRVMILKRKTCDSLLPLRARNRRWRGGSGI
jgi:hypothetical protein